MPTQDKHPPHIRSAGQFNALVLSTCESPITHDNPTTPEYIIASTYKLTTPSIYKLKSSSTYKLKNLSTHIPTNASIQKLKLLLFILQYRSNFHSVLAKIQAIKQVNNYYFQIFTLFDLSVFKNRTCILHHLAFLVWLPAHIFLLPLTPFLPLKFHFLAAILAFLAMCFMVLKGFVYIIAVYFYAFCLAFSSILHCVQHHFTLRLAANRTAFSTKTHCVQRHIAPRFAPKRTSFCYKSPKNGCQWRSV